MNALPKTSGLIVLCCAMNVTHAQQPAPSAEPTTAPAATSTPAAESKPKSSKATPQSEAGEPRANTSRAATAQSEAGEPRAGTSRPAATSGTGGRPSTAGQKGPGATDRLELGTATVTGDREQPKVMYIVPWKKSDIGDLAGKPMNSLVDEILAPVDRDVFKREVVYYKAVQADTSQNGAPGRPSDQGEK